MVSDNPVVAGRLLGMLTVGSTSLRYIADKGPARSNYVEDTDDLDGAEAGQQHNGSLFSTLNIAFDVLLINQ